MTRKHATVDGIRMSWIEQGEGVPVVLVHGIPTSPELWRKVMPRLTGVHALAWEMVGYGQSIEQGRGRDISVSQQANYLAAWMQHLGVGKAILAGHDLGGGVVQIAAVRRPELCGGLFLTNAIGYDSWPIPSVAALKAAAPVMRHLPQPLFKLLLMSLLYRGHDSKEEALEAFRVHTPNYLAAGGAAALIRQIEQLKNSDTLAVAAELPQLGLPARIAWGDGDPFQKIHYGERFSSDLRAPLRRIPGAKHFTPEDHPAIIAEEIMALVGEATRGVAGCPRRRGRPRPSGLGRRGRPSLRLGFHASRRSVKSASRKDGSAYVQFLFADQGPGRDPSAYRGDARHDGQPAAVSRQLPLVTLDRRAGGKRNGRFRAAREASLPFIHDPVPAATRPRPPFTRLPPTSGSSRPLIEGKANP